MMQITHAVSGAAVGKYAPNPLFAFLLGVFIHFVIDMIPHYWPKGEVFKDKLLNYLLVADYALTILFIAILIFTKTLTTNMAWGMAGSLITDIVLVGIAPIFKSKLGRWHETRQSHLEKPITFLTDIAVIAVGMAIIFLVK